MGLARPATHRPAHLEQGAAPAGKVEAGRQGAVIRAHLPAAHIGALIWQGILSHLQWWGGHDVEGKLRWGRQQLGRVLPWHGERMGG